MISLHPHLNRADLITATRLEQRSNVTKLLRRRWWNLLGLSHSKLDAIDDAGNTALHYAAQNNDSYSVHKLLEAGARTDIPNHCEGTALHVALASGSPALVDEILSADNGRSVEIASVLDSSTPLHLAVRRGFRSFVRRLLQLGADPNAEDKAGHNALDLAFAGRDSAIIVALIHAGGDLETDTTPATVNKLLYRAILDDYPDVVRLLLDRGADVNRTIPAEGLPPLSIALAYRRPEIAVMLIDASAEYGPDSNGNTALHLASRQGYVDIVRRLLLYDAPIDALDARGITPAGVAAECGRLEVLRTLLAEHANPHGLLTLAAENDHYEIVGHLVLGDFAVDVNEDAGNGRSPLRAACHNGHEAIAQFLRLHGATRIPKANGQS